MRLCDVLRTAAWLAGTLVPQQAIRALLSRDFNPTPSVRDYQLKWADMLSATEESTEVLEPRVRPVRVSRAADSPAAGERIPDNRPAAGRTFGKVERDQYFAGLTWPEPKVDPVQAALEEADLSVTVHRWPPGDEPDRWTQIEHVATMIEVWLEEVGPTTTAQDLAARIVDMLAADKRIAERLDGAK